MPLKKGKSKKVISANIKEIMHSYHKTGTIGTSTPESNDKAQKQAIAIAFDMAVKKK
jgi:flavin-binding protein dodecin